MAVSAQLTQLNGEAERLAAKIEAAVAKREAAMAAMIPDDKAFYKEVYDNLVAEKQQLESRREALERQLGAGSFRQVDLHLLQQLRLGHLGMPISSTDKMIYAHLAILNDRIDPERSCQADVLMDCACSMELVLPGQKSVQLGLDVMDERPARGFEDNLVGMTIFAPVRVTIALEDDNGNVIKKAAFLEPSSRTSEYQLALSVRRDTPKAVFEDWPKTHTDGSLEVSPIKRLPKPEHAPDCLLGIEGLRKLRLTVDFERSIIMPLVVEDVILVSGRTLGPLFDAEHADASPHAQ